MHHIPNIEAYNLIGWPERHACFACTNQKLWERSMALIVRSFERSLGAGNNVPLEKQSAYIPSKGVCNGRSRCQMPQKTTSE